MSGAPVLISSPRVGPEEEAAVLSVLRSGHLASGPWVEEFEDLAKTMAGSRHAIAVANGTVALEAAFAVSGIGPGDEVITTPATFAATLNALWHTGATIRFADVTSDHTIDPESVRALIGPRTTPIVPVHLYGQAADLTALQALAQRHGLQVIEDAAQAHGAEADGHPVGSQGLATFSFYATKNITAGEGGIVTCQDDDQARELRLLRNQGMARRYEYERIGRNLRMTDLQAAVAVPQMRRLADIVSARARVARSLLDELAGVPDLVLPPEVENRSTVWHQFTVLLPQGANRATTAEAMLDLGVHTGVYYPRLVWDHEVYRASDRVRRDETPVAQRLVDRCLSLPVHPGAEPFTKRIGEALRSALADQS